MNYVVCVPSYKRSKLCNDKTLSTLRRLNIPKEHVNVFVANKEEYDEYERDLDKSLYNEIVSGEKGLVKQRDFIERKYKEGQHIIFFDDDVSDIDLSMSDIFRKKSLDFFFKAAFEECEKKNSYIWGVYPVFNPFFRKDRPEITVGLKFIVGCFYGIINRPKLKDIKLTITRENSQKEDSERTLRYYEHDGLTIRFDKIGIKTVFYGKEGGLGRFEERLKPQEIATKLLLKKYPDYGTLMVRKSGVHEFKFKRLGPKYHKNTPNKTRRSRRVIRRRKSKKNVPRM